MTNFVLVNNASTTLASAAASGATSLVLASATNFPVSIPGGFVLPVTLNDAATRAIFEIVYVTAISGTTLTVSRGQEGTTAQNWGVGDFAAVQMTAGAAAGGLIQRFANMQVFTSGGTFTPPASVNNVHFRVLGGGGGGGGSNNATASAGGGGGGGYTEGFAAVTPGSGITVTVGAAGTAGTNAPTNGGTGGTSSFGSSGSATGGVGGLAGSGASNIATGGLGGTGSGSGNLNATGPTGFIGTAAYSIAFGGGGANSAFGGGGQPAANTSGGAAAGFGAGGAGGSAGGVGGVGTAGLVVVEW